MCSWLSGLLPAVVIKAVRGWQAPACSAMPGPMTLDERGRRQIRFEYRQSDHAGIIQGRSSTNPVQVPLTRPRS